MNYPLVLWFLSAMAVAVNSLDCYQCQTLAGEGCDDPFNPNNQISSGFLGECDDDSFCVKYKTIVKIRDSGYINGWERHSVVVTRACEARQGKSQGCTGWQNNGGITIKCFCGSDGCNGGRTLIPSTSLTLFSVVAVALALVRRLV